MEYLLQFGRHLQSSSYANGEGPGAQRVLSKVNEKKVFAEDYGNIDFSNEVRLLRWKDR